MEKICDYCGVKYDDGLSVCPSCGAPNNFVRHGDGVPRTIEELKQWYKDANLPPEETTRFFIGRNYTERCAFGIYKDENTGDFIVYKNKDTGVRAIRYQGKDEAYAVNELYLRLKEEITNQKAHQGMQFGGSPNRRDRVASTPFPVKIVILIFVTIFIVALPRGINPNGHWGIYQVATFLLLVKGLFSKKGNSKVFNASVRLTGMLISTLCTVLCITLVVGLIVGARKTNNGYYTIDDKHYYKRFESWYEYENDDWHSTDKPVVDNGSTLDSYYTGSSYDSSADYSNFKYSDAGSWSSSDSWDSSSSWDSGSTDFSSDW